VKCDDEFDDHMHAVDQAVDIETTVTCQLISRLRIFNPCSLGPAFSVDPTAFTKQYNLVLSEGR